MPFLSFIEPIFLFQKLDWLHYEKLQNGKTAFFCGSLLKDMSKQFISATELGPAGLFVCDSDRPTASVWVEKELL